MTHPIRTLVESIMPHLSGEWTLEQPWDHYIRLIRADGATFGFRFDGSRLCVRPICPEMPEGAACTPGFYGISDNVSPCTFDRNREPAVLAREINRRVILPWNDLLHRVEEARLAKIAERDAQQALLDELLRISGGDTRNGPVSHGREVDLHATGVDGSSVKVCVPAWNSTLNITARSVTPDMAKKLLAVLAGNSPIR